MKKASRAHICWWWRNIHYSILLGGKPSFVNMLFMQILIAGTRVALPGPMRVLWPVGTGEGQ